MALSAAFEDSRFDPIKKEEFPKLLCEVSILHTFEEAKDFNDWKVGVHGVAIDFTVFNEIEHKNSNFTGNAIFLPSVAPQNGWDTTETVKKLIRKAGYQGPVDFNKIIIKTTRHQASHCNATFSEYIEWKKLRQNKEIL